MALNFKRALKKTLAEILALLNLYYAMPNYAYADSAKKVKSTVEEKIKPGEVQLDRLPPAYLEVEKAEHIAELMGDLRNKLGSPLSATICKLPGEQYQLTFNQSCPRIVERRGQLLLDTTKAAQATTKIDEQELRQHIEKAFEKGMRVLPFYDDNGKFDKAKGIGVYRQDSSVSTDITNPTITIFWPEPEPSAQPHIPRIEQPSTQPQIPQGLNLEQPVLPEIPRSLRDYLEFDIAGSFGSKIERTDTETKDEHGADVSRNINSALDGLSAAGYLRFRPLSWAQLIGTIDFTQSTGNRGSEKLAIDDLEYMLGGALVLPLKRGYVAFGGAYVKNSFDSTVSGGDANVPINLSKERHSSGWSAFIDARQLPLDSVVRLHYGKLDLDGSQHTLIKLSKNFGFPDDSTNASLGGKIVRYGLRAECWPIALGRHAALGFGVAVEHNERNERARLRKQGMPELVTDTSSSTNSYSLSAGLKLAELIRLKVRYTTIDPDAQSAQIRDRGAYSLDVKLELEYR